MKNIFFSLVFLLGTLNMVSFQEKTKEEIAEINTKIQQLLNGAEIAVNVLNFDEALSQLNKALELSKQINDQQSIALSSGVLGQLFYTRHDYDRALTEFQRAIAIQREINDEPGLAYSYLNYAKVFNAKGETTRALNYLKLAEEFYRKTEQDEYIGIVHLNRAIIYLNTERNAEVIDRALGELNNAEQYLNKTNNLYERSRLHYFKSRAYVAKDEYDLAEREALKSLEIAQDHGFGSMIMFSQKLLSNVYEEKGEFQKSLALLKRSDNVRDSIFNLNREALALDANTRYGVDALRNNLVELKKQNEEQEKSLKVNKLTTI